MKKEHIFKGGIELKECSSCKRWKELNCFSKNKSSHDGLKHYCKECASEKGNITKKKVMQNGIEKLKCKKKSEPKENWKKN